MVWCSNQLSYIPTRNGLREVGAYNSSDVDFKWKGHQGHSWAVRGSCLFKRTIADCLACFVQIIIRGTVGGWQGDIAVDVISFGYGACPTSDSSKFMKSEQIHFDVQKKKEENVASCKSSSETSFHKSVTSSNMCSYVQEMVKKLSILCMWIKLNMCFDVCCQNLMTENDMCTPKCWWSQSGFAKWFWSGQFVPCFRRCRTENNIWL